MPVESGGHDRWEICDGSNRVGEFPGALIAKINAGPGQDGWRIGRGFEERERFGAGLAGGGGQLDWDVLVGLDFDQLTLVGASDEKGIEGVFNEGGQGGEFEWGRAAE